MNQNATAGTNLTGLVAAPQRSQEMLTGTEEFPPSSEGSAEDLALVRITYAKEVEPLGSMPPLVHGEGKGKSAAKAVKGEQLLLFMDKLGERLAFERTGTRLYEALVSKHEAFGSFPGGPTRDDLEHLRQEESQHFRLL